MRSKSFTERALTTPPTWRRKPGGKAVKVKKGNSCSNEKKREKLQMTLCPLDSVITNEHAKNLFRHKQSRNRAKGFLKASKMYAIHRPALWG